MFVAGAILAISGAGAAGSILASAVLLLAGCMCVWLFAARDAASPRRFRLLPIHATSLAHPVGCGIAMNFVLGLSMMSFSVYGPILLIRLYGLTPLKAGLVVVTESLGWGAGAFFLSGLAPAYEGRLIRLGSVLLAAGLAAKAWFVPHGPLWIVVASAFVGTAGFGIIWGYVIKHVVASAGRDDRDRASSMLPSTPDRLRNRRRADRYHRQRARVRADVAARGIQGSRTLALRRLRAARPDRNLDRMAIQFPHHTHP